MAFFLTLPGGSSLACGGSCSCEASGPETDDPIPPFHIRYPDYGWNSENPSNSEFLEE
jgi:hypothetical protein